MIRRPDRPALHLVRGGLAGDCVAIPSPAVRAARSAARVVSAAQVLAATLSAVPGLLELLDGATPEGHDLLALLDCVNEYEAYSANMPVMDG